MHRALKRLLPDAKGDARLVVVANVDIRGFTKFSETVDSVLALLYVRKTFDRILTKYFHNAEFFKLTGDGLLLIFPWDDESLQAVVRKVVSDSLELVAAFPTLVADDDAINFPVPTNIGIGLARGSASRLRTRQTTLDYSGRPLNLASRLMEVARPSGVVADAGFGINLLTPETQEKFYSDEVYLSGISERDPISIHATSGYTVISPRYRHPVSEAQWERIRSSLTLRDLRDHGPVFTYILPSKPLDTSQITVEIQSPIHRNGKPDPSGIVNTWDMAFEYLLDAGKPALKLRYDSVVKMMRDQKIPWNRSARLHIDFPKG